jgi:hypothetical protein
MRMHKVNKVGSLLAQGLLSAGMIYALIAIAAVPAAACTPTQCNNLATAADAICGSRFGTGCENAIVISCNASGYVIQCETPAFQNCGFIDGTCG